MFRLVADDSSSITMTGGSVGQITFLGDGLETFGSSSLTIEGGWIYGDLDAYDLSAVTIAGGRFYEYRPLYIDNVLYAYGSATITIVGSGFEVDGIPVPYGDLEAPVGRLTGTLASGDPLDVVFYQGGVSYCTGGPCSGTIALVPEPCAALLLGLGLLGLAAGRRR